MKEEFERPGGRRPQIIEIAFDSQQRIRLLARFQPRMNALEKRTNGGRVLPGVGPGRGRSFQEPHRRAVVQTGDGADGLAGNAKNEARIGKKAIIVLTYVFALDVAALFARRTDNCGIISCIEKRAQNPALRVLPAVLPAC
jgi:hypothetical protein